MGSGRGKYSFFIVWIFKNYIYFITFTSLDPYLAFDSQINALIMPPLRAATGRSVPLSVYTYPKILLPYMFFLKYSQTS